MVIFGRSLPKSIMFLSKNIPTWHVKNFKKIGATAFELLREKNRKLINRFIWSFAHIFATLFMSAIAKIQTDMYNFSELRAKFSILKKSKIEHPLKGGIVCGAYFIPIFKIFSWESVKNKVSGIISTLTNNLWRVFKNTFIEKYRKLSLWHEFEICVQKKKFICGEKHN